MIKLPSNFIWHSIIPFLLGYLYYLDVVLIKFFHFLIACNFFFFLFPIALHVVIWLGDHFNDLLGTQNTF